MTQPTFAEAAGKAASPEAGCCTPRSATPTLTGAMRTKSDTRSLERGVRLVTGLVRQATVNQVCNCSGQLTVLGAVPVTVNSPYWGVTKCSGLAHAAPTGTGGEPGLS